MFEFHAIETELAGHAAFGDARRILDRRRAFALLSLEEAASRVAETEELWRHLLRRMRTGTSDFPTAAGCPLRIHPPGASFEIALWDPDVPASIFKRRFESAFHASCPNSPW